MGRDSIQRGKIIITYDDTILRLTGIQPLKQIEREFKTVAETRKYKTREKTRLYGGDGSFIEAESLLRDRFGESFPIVQVPSDQIESIENSFLDRNEFLEFARSFYDHDGKMEYGDALTAYLYTVFTHLGAEGPMMGLFNNRLISVGDYNQVNQHGIVAYANGNHFSQAQLTKTLDKRLDPPKFTGFVGVRLPKLQGQSPESFVLSANVPEDTPTETLDKVIGKNGISLVATKKGKHLSVTPDIPPGYTLPTKDTLVDTIVKIQKTYSNLTS